jgi:hypothetical protein
MRPGQSRGHSILRYAEGGLVARMLHGQPSVATPGFVRTCHGELSRPPSDIGARLVPRGHCTILAYDVSMCQVARKKARACGSSRRSSRRARVPVARIAGSGGARSAATVTKSFRRPRAPTAGIQPCGRTHLVDRSTTHLQTRPQHSSVRLDPTQALGHDPPNGDTQRREQIGPHGMMVVRFREVLVQD